MKGIKKSFQVTGFCRSPQETRKSSPTGSVTSSVSNVMLTPSRQLTDAEKLRKVISELVDTERTYVKVFIFKQYTECVICLCLCLRINVLHNKFMIWSDTLFCVRKNQVVTGQK